jgi:peptidoglycan/LPS O-acetylase OafA/YrhL
MNLTDLQQLRFLDPFRRIISGGRLIPEIDGLRFVAIFSVYLYHLAGDVLRHAGPDYPLHLASSWLFRITQVLNVGVPLFFVISGFILSLPFAEHRRNLREPVSVQQYLRRRVTRLEPPYMLCLFLFFALKRAAGRAAAAAMLPNLIASLLYVHNPIFGRPSDIEFVAWSLEIEIQFYILVPLLALFFAIEATHVRRWALVASVLLATALSRGVPQSPVFQLSLLAYGQYFLVGFVLTEIYLSAKRKSSAVRLWDLVSLAGWAALLALRIRGGAIAEWILPWLILVLYAAAFEGGVMRRLITNPWLTTIGGMCYSIYLLHNYAIAALGMVTERIGASSSFEVRVLIQLLLMSPVVLAVGALYFRWIERPCMRPDWPSRIRTFFASATESPVAVPPKG